MARVEEFTITLKNGESATVRGVRLREGVWFYHKGEDGRYYLDHEPTGRFLTSAKTVKALKELINEPEFFGNEFIALFDAVNRWNNRYHYKV